MSDQAARKATLKDVVSVIVLFSIIGLLAYGIYSDKVQFKGDIDVGVLEGFLIGTAASAIVKWLFGD